METPRDDWLTGARVERLWRVLVAVRKHGPSGSRGVGKNKHSGAHAGDRGLTSRAWRWCLSAPVSCRNNMDTFAPAAWVSVWQPRITGTRGPYSHDLCCSPAVSRRRDGDSPSFGTAR